MNAGRMRLSLGQIAFQAAIVAAIVAAFASGGWQAPYRAGGWVVLFALLAVLIAVLSVRGRQASWASSLLVHGADIVLALVLFAITLAMLDGFPAGELPGAPFWFFVTASWLFAWATVSNLSAADIRGAQGRIASILIPALFGITVLFLWEAVARGAGIPFVLLPPPSAIGARIAASIPILAADFNQTVLKAVLFGFAAGSLAGFLVAILADRYRFLADGLLPIGNLVSALPIIGIAPIMVIWFGFDWQSKAAVVIVMTFFPMLVNTIAGLASAGRMERDLMRTYAAGHWQTLLKLRLPAAMPFIFNALKINSTLAMIGAIVSEFFGTPIVGMGFRISTEVGRMNLDMVWAEIALAALVGSLFYGALALLERITTFWHPSYRR